MKKYKLKALVANLGYLHNQAGEIVEIELTEEAHKQLLEKGIIEDVKATPKAKK